MTKKIFQIGEVFGETHVFFVKVSTTRREWVRTPLGGFINHTLQEPNCYISTNTEERILHSIRPIKTRRRTNNIL